MTGPRSPTTSPRRPDPARPWIVLANGLGGGTLVWRGQIEYLRDRYRLLSWDYRGLYGSERPRPESPGAYAVANHVRDLEAVLAAERIERAGLAGWSVGVQVILETTRRLRGVAHSLVLVGGAWARPLDALTPRPLVRAAILPFLELFRRAHAFGPLARRPIGRREAAVWMKRLGLVGRAADETVLAELTASVARLDLDAFLRNLKAFAEHDAGDALSAVDVPALVIAGDRDPLLPRGRSPSRWRPASPGPSSSSCRGGAHALPLEYPELVALRIERFYREHGL